MVPAMSTHGFSDIRWFETLGSTNSYLAGEARRGAPENLVVAALHQTAGRGRLDRRWEAPPGASLLASVLLRPEIPPDRLHLCTGAVALAGADACRALTGVSPELKWPNDLLVADRKLAGILAESVSDSPGDTGGRMAVVVGIGCNIDWPGPPGAGGTSLRQEGGRPVSPRELLEGVLGMLWPRVLQLATRTGQDELAGELRRRTATLGRWVKVELLGTAEPVVGRAVGLTDSGHLLVEAGGALQEVVAGDVVHLRPTDDRPETR